MYLLKKDINEDNVVGYFLVPGSTKDNIVITAEEKKVNIKVNENEFWEADEQVLSTSLPIKEVTAKVENGILKVKIQYDIPKKKSVKISID